MTHRYFTVAILLLTCIVMVSACGFKLRGSLDISPDMAPVYIEANSVFQLAKQLENLLKANKVAIASNSKPANSTITLISDARSQRVLSVDGSGQAREYLLEYTVNFSTQIKAAPVTEDSITVSRRLVFDQDAVLATTNEANVVYRELQRNAAQSILLKLQAQSRALEAGKATK